MDDSKTTLKAYLVRPPKNWHVTDNRVNSLCNSGLTYAGKPAHISIRDKLKHKLYDLKAYNKLTSRLCPAKVYTWRKVNKHYQPFVQHENCVQCKACCVKPACSSIA